MKPNIYVMYPNHDIEVKKGNTADLRKLKDNQMVCMGDGKTFYYLLTEKPT